MSASYTSKIIKASALVADTHLLLSEWDATRSPSANLRRFQEENVLAKSSKGRLRDVLAIFRQRYLQDAEVAEALSVLAVGPSSKTLDRLLFYHAALNDPLLYDVVRDYLFPRYLAGRTNVHFDEVDRQLKTWVDEGKTSGTWSPPTRRRVAQGLLATLRDFGVLEGANDKRLTPPYLPLGAFAYVAFRLARRARAGTKVIDHPDWGLFFLTPTAVGHFFSEAHQHRLLGYHAAGDVIRLDFPATTLPEYARVIAERAA